MATEKVVYLSDDGTQHETREAAEHHDRRTNLALALGVFTEHFPEDGYDSEAAAAWLLKTYTMERKENAND